MFELKWVFIILGGLSVLYLLYVFLSGFSDMLHNMQVRKMVKKIPSNGYGSPSVPIKAASKHVQVTQVELHWPGHGNGPGETNPYFNSTLDVYITTDGDQFTAEKFGFGKPQGTTRTHLGRNRWRYEIPLNEPVPPKEDRAEWKRMEAREWAAMFGFDAYKNGLPEVGDPSQACSGRYGT